MQGGPRASPTATKGRYGDNSTLVAVNFALPVRQHCSSSSQLHDKAAARLHSGHSSSIFEF